MRLRQRVSFIEHKLQHGSRAKKFYAFSFDDDNIILKLYRKQVSHARHI